jgi:hypothetical protein
MSIFREDFLSRVKSRGASVKTQEEPPTQSENVPEQKPDTQMEELARKARAAGHTGPLVVGPPRSSLPADGTDCQSFGNTVIDGAPEPITADLLPSNIDDDKGVTVSDTLEPGRLPPAVWFDRFIGLGAGTRRVALEDAIECIRLVIAELQSESAAREAEIRLVTPTVPLSALYAECMRLSGHAACWGVVQELQLKARAQQGVRPNQGLPVVALCRPPANNGANWSSALAFDAQQVQMLEQRCWPGV